MIERPKNGERNARNKRSKEDGDYLSSFCKADKLLLLCKSVAVWSSLESTYEPAIIHLSQVYLQVYTICGTQMR